MSELFRGKSAVSIMTGQDRALKAECSRAIAAVCGHVVHGQNLWILLGYRSERTFQLAVQQGKTPSDLFHPIPGRKGKFAYAYQLARYFVDEHIDWKARLADVQAASVGGKKPN